MDLYADIDKVTQLPWRNDNASFTRRSSPSEAIRDRKMNERKVKPPRNIQLAEQHEMQEYESDTQDNSFNEYEIASSIEAVNGGMSYSNEYIEYHWRSGNSFNDKKSDVSNNTSDSEESKIKEDILKKCKLSRNAAIIGLINNNKISIGDLYMKNHSSDDGKGQQNTVHLINHPEDPEILIHPFQANAGSKANRKADSTFVVDHVGKKTTVTSRQYYINEVDDDSSFAFVKKGSTST